MSNLNNKKFNAKILLFGEYSVIRNSKALATPYSLFSGHLTFPSSNNQRRVDTELKAFSTFIQKRIERNENKFPFKINEFKFDIGQGLFFDSSIPQGYGAGSSGALCAAIFNQYAQIPQGKLEDLSYLKECFSFLESHFHGSSSGIDPLISYTDKSLLLDGKGGFEQIELPRFEDRGGAIFLLNTGRPRRTEPLVNLFLEKCSSKDFQYLCDKVLRPINDNCIEYFLSGDIQKLFECIEELSVFQYEHFMPMIPNLFREKWMEGLDNKKFFFKLCGAGGGGFILGFTRDLKSIGESFESHEIRPIFRF